MAQTMQDLQDAIAALDGKIAEIETTLTDFAADFAAAIAKLQADITAGVDTTASVSALAALATRADTLAASLKGLDSTAEGVTGVVTP